MRRFLATFLVELLTFGLFLQPVVVKAGKKSSETIPIKHLVVIFQENISFDHYFGTYPNATNPSGEPVFTALPGTPTVNGLSGSLLTDNPNALNTTNGTGAVNPFRLDRTQAATNDQNHNYGPEQAAFHGGLMDLFPFSVGTAGPPPGGSAQGDSKGLTMGYYDGNTVTAMWNYAQRFAMSDNSYDTNFGPSTPGAINLISGQTNGVINNVNGTGAVTSDGSPSGLSDTGDADPVGDVCSTPTGEKFQMSGQNIGNLLNNAGVTWGFFEGGFDLTVTNPNGSTGCGRNTTSAITNSLKADYIPHHQPFQYYASTANPTHARPSSFSSIGSTDAANHQYDMHDFYDAINHGNYPAVSFLKAPGYQDGHAGYSDPLDEQTFVVQVINFLQQNADWEHTAVVIAYDDSDGWYDHQMSPIVNQSASPSDALLGPGSCGTATAAMAGIGVTHAQGRCGYGPRQPLLVISPWAKQNFVDHAITDQTSILQFIEDTWLDGERIGQGSFDALAGTLMNMFDFTNQNRQHYILDPSTGEVKK
jgi:phospholipase C